MTSESTAHYPIGRVTRSKRDAARTYDSLSGVYDLLSRGLEWKLTEEGLKELEPKTGESVLEIGFGAGHGLLYNARRVGPGGKVIGVDISPGMIRSARSRIDDAHFADVVELTRGDGSTLAFAPESFDAAFMSFVLELFDTPEIPVVLSEALRVLKPGGRICVVALSIRGHGPVLRMYGWAHEHFPNYADCRPIRAEEFVKDAGFRIQQSRSASMWGLPVEIVVGIKAKSNGESPSAI